MVIIHLDLAMYKWYEIIDFVEMGIVTLDEVIESGIAFRFFSDHLHDYIRTAIKNTEVTHIINHTILDIGL